MSAHHSRIHSSRLHSSSCKDTCGSLLKQESFLYIHAELPSGGLVAFRMRLSDSNILRCYQRRLIGYACSLQRVSSFSRYTHRNRSTSNSLV